MTLSRTQAWKGSSADPFDVVSEWPDVPTALQALRAVGPSWAAIEHVGVSKFDEVMTAALTEVLDPQLGIRLTSEHFWITARKPG